MSVHEQGFDGHAPWQEPVAAVLPSCPPRILWAATIYRRLLKRAFDVAVVILLILPVGLTVALIALLVAVEGGRPFFRQQRVGQGGRAFTMWKIRTMCRDADQALASHLAANPQARAEWDSAQKLRDDPRITRLGRILRKTSLDELPQLWNVLRGDMSLVGPRPMMVQQVPLYPGNSYYRLRPGITGIWQVSDRNKSSFADRAGFDAEYDQTLGFGTDLRILLATVRVVLRGTGC